MIGWCRAQNGMRHTGRLARILRHIIVLPMLIYVSINRRALCRTAVVWKIGVHDNGSVAERSKALV